MRSLLLVGMGLVVAACSSSTDGSSEPVNCKIGELDGTWSVSYAEKDGTCGDLASETVVLQPGKATGDSPCTFAANNISADKCRIDQDFTCPLATGSGSQHWVGTTKQISDTKLSGSMTVQAAVGGQACRSTYDVTWIRQ